MASFAGTDADGHAIELAVYGRDAADAQWLRKVWRFCIYRDSGPTLRPQPAATGGARGVPDVPGGARRHHRSPRSWRPDDAVRPTTPPSSHGYPKDTGSPSWRRTTCSDDDVDGFLRSVLLLRQAGISHGALSPETVLVTNEGPLLRDFRRASSSAPAMRTDRDLAAAVAAAAVVVGVDRAVAATCRVLDTETIQAVLTRCSAPRSTPRPSAWPESQKGFLEVAARVARHRRRGRGARSWWRRSGSAGPTC